MACPPNSVCAVIPTRGDLDLGAITAHLSGYREFSRIEVVAGETPFNRYRVASLAEEPYIYTQDDDCQTELEPLFAAFTPGSGVMVNAMTREHAREYRGRFTLIGFGALFDRKLLSVFDGYERDALFFRESDRIMGSVPHRTVYPRIFISSDASLPNRFWRQPEHLLTRRRMEQRILARQRSQR